MHNLTFIASFYTVSSHGFNRQLNLTATTQSLKLGLITKHNIHKRQYVFNTRLIFHHHFRIR